MTSGWCYSASMVILLYGPDSYSKSQKLRELRISIVERNPSIAQGAFDMEQEQELYSLHEFSTVTGLFSEGKRLAVVRNGLSVFTQGVFQAIVARAAQDPDVVLLLHEDREKKLEKKEETFCKKNGIQAQYFAKPTEATVRVRVKQFAKEMGVEVDDAALSFLIEEHGGNIFAIISDIQKWSSVTHTIDSTFLSKTGEYVSEIGLFDFSQAILYGKPLREQLAMFEHICSQGTDLFAVFNIAAKMTASADLITALADADLKIKQGLIDIDQAITALILR